MEFKPYLLFMAKDERERFAAAVESSVGHLQNLVYQPDKKTCATDLAVRIERESPKFGMHQTVHRWDLRPNDWWEHWPELIGAKGAPKVPKKAAKRVAKAVA